LYHKSSKFSSVLDTTLCDTVHHWFTSLWFSQGTLISSTNKTDHHDLTEILWKGHHFCNKNWPDKRGDLQQFTCILLSQCIWNLARSEGMTFDERGLIRRGLMFRFYTRATMEDNNYYPLNKWFNWNIVKEHP
jgi:hypothetical protein